MSDCLAIERHGSALLLILDRPAAMNALDRDLLLALTAAFRRHSADEDVASIVVTGRGDRAFCAGLDIKMLGGDPTVLDRIVATGSDMNVADAITDCVVPVIAAVNGVAITGGLEIVLACDIVIASVRASFADTHVAMGITPGWGLSQRLPRIVGPNRARDMSLGGLKIDAATALAWGLASRVAVADDLIATATTLIAHSSPAIVAGIRRYKALINDGLSGELIAGLGLERQAALAANAALSRDDVQRNSATVIATGR